MTKPQSYTIENGQIFRLRRGTAEALAAEGILTLVHGSKLETRYPLTPKGEAFFSHVGPARFKWLEAPGVSVVERDTKEEVETGFSVSPTAFGLPASLKKVSRLVRESRNPASPHYDPTVYPDER